MESNGTCHVAPCSRCPPRRQRTSAHLPGRRRWSCRREHRPGRRSPVPVRAGSSIASARSPWRGPRGSRPRSPLTASDWPSGAKAMASESCRSIRALASAVACFTIPHDHLAVRRAERQEPAVPRETGAENASRRAVEGSEGPPASQVPELESARPGRWRPASFRRARRRASE